PGIDVGRAQVYVGSLDETVAEKHWGIRKGSVLVRKNFGRQQYIVYLDKTIRGWILKGAEKLPPDPAIVEEPATRAKNSFAIREEIIGHTQSRCKVLVIGSVETSSQIPGCVNGPHHSTIRNAGERVLSAAGIEI